MKGREISSLYRSYSPKMAHYTTDGNGRDQYINYNNGGFWSRGVKVYMGSQRGSEVSQRYQLKPLMKHVAPFKYHSNGTGRDGYIISESGGLKRDQKALNEYHLKDFLRTPQSCIFKFHSNVNRNGSLAKTHYVSKAELDTNQQIKKIEKGIIDRLYNKEKSKKFNLNMKKSNIELPEIEVESKYAKTDSNFFRSSIDKIHSYESHKREYEKNLNNYLHIKIRK
jgi:hypothetical protein